MVRQSSIDGRRNPRISVRTRRNGLARFYDATVAHGATIPELDMVDDQYADRSHRFDGNLLASRIRRCATLQLGSEASIKTCANV